MIIMARHMTLLPIVSIWLKIASSASLCMLPLLSQTKRINRSKAKELDVLSSGVAIDELKMKQMFGNDETLGVELLIYPTNFLFLVGGD